MEIPNPNLLFTAETYLKLRNLTEAGREQTIQVVLAPYHRAHVDGFHLQYYLMPQQLLLLSQ